MIKIIAKIPVKAEKLNDFKTLGTELVKKSRGEIGNISYSLNISTSDPLLFAFIEIWKDQDAINSHNNSEHFTRIFPQLAAMASGEVVGEFYTEFC